MNWLGKLIVSFFLACGCVAGQAATQYVKFVAEFVNQPVDGPSQSGPDPKDPNQTAIGNMCSAIVRDNILWVYNHGIKNATVALSPDDWVSDGVPLKDSIRFFLSYSGHYTIYIEFTGGRLIGEFDYTRLPFPSTMEWHYHVTDYYEDTVYTRTILPKDTVVNGKTYQQVDGFLLKGDNRRAWLLVDSAGVLVERLLYNFNLQVGDSIRMIYLYDDAAQNNQQTYAKVTCWDTVFLANGLCAQRICYDIRPDDIEYIGSVEGILGACVVPMPLGVDRRFQCCTMGDALLYEVSSGACARIGDITDLKEPSPSGNNQPVVRKILDNGQVLIVAPGGEKYDLNGGAHY